jgi:uncharacterized protein YfiM (DUF2279 family)
VGEGAEDVEAPLSSAELAAGGTALRGEDEMRPKKLTRIQFDRKKKLLETMAGRVHVLLD